MYFSNFLVNCICSTIFFCTLSLLKYVLEKHHLNTIIALHAFIYSLKYLHTFLKFPVFRCLVLSYRPRFQNNSWSRAFVLPLFPLPWGQDIRELTERNKCVNTAAFQPRSVMSQRSTDPPMEKKCSETWAFGSPVIVNSPHCHVWLSQLHNIGGVYILMR